MKNNKTYLRFCGIDIGKNRHVFCIQEAQGQLIQKPTGVQNHAQGLDILLRCLKRSGRSRSILIGMEATGHYWYHVHDFLVQHGYQVVVLNPIVTSQRRKNTVRKGKTDNRDAKQIAHVLAQGDYQRSVIPTDLAMNCRQLTRLRYRLVDQKVRIKQFIGARLHAVWPEYETLFSDPLGTTARTLLYHSPTPQDLLKLDVQQIDELIRRPSRGRFGLDKAQAIRTSAQHSVGIERGLESFRFNLRLLLRQLEAYELGIEEIDREIQTILSQVPSYLLSLPGATSESAVSLYGELHPIASFKQANQLVAFAGLDPVVYQSGEYPKADSAVVVRHISKRGSPYLRQTLWLMAQRAIWQPGPLRDLWLKKRRQGKHHLTAVTLVAGRLCHIIWRIMTDQRDYLPDGCPKKEH